MYINHWHRDKWELCCQRYAQPLSSWSRYSHSVMQYLAIKMDSSFRTSIRHAKKKTTTTHNLPQRDSWLIIPRGVLIISHRFSFAITRICTFNFNLLLIFFSTKSHPRWIHVSRSTINPCFNAAVYIYYYYYYHYYDLRTNEKWHERSAALDFMFYCFVRTSEKISTAQQVLDGMGDFVRKTSRINQNMNINSLMK